MHPKQSAKPVQVDNKTYDVMSVKKGGMAQVWLLEQRFDEPFDPIYRRRIAVKTFNVGSDVSQIEDELNIWISLDSPYILPLNKIGRLNYRLAAIMPLVWGTLDDHLQAKGSLSESSVVRIIESVAKGLDYAWSLFRILHLDLKPSNVLTEDLPDAVPKIGDWGISRLAADRRLSIGSSAAKGVNGSFDLHTAYGAGTPLYMAPERFSGEWKLSPSADIYSLGMMAIHLSTGLLPFRFGQIDPLDEIVTAAYHENAARLLVDRQTSFRQFCLGCLHPDPERRIATYRQVFSLLRSIPKT